MTKLDSLVVTGDLILLDPEQRVQFYVQVCNAMGLDFRTRPLQYFEQIDRNGKRNLILYALRNASAQLRAKHNLSVTLSAPEFSFDTVIFTATVKNLNGQQDSAVGAESLKDLVGKEYADRIMAAQTKAKRRAILDFVGSGMLDESEIEGMNGSVVEVTDSQLKGYVPIPAAPAPATASAPATEVLELKGEDAKVFVEAIVNPPAPVPALVAAAEKTKDDASEREITSRLNTYRRDILQQGGMRPSKGFGIAAKWSKFVAKSAPNKSIEEYTTLLNALDILLTQTGAAGVVTEIERVIA